jgi:hypothetical protein
LVDYKLCQLFHVNEVAFERDGEMDASEGPPRILEAHTSRYPPCIEGVQEVVQDLSLPRGFDGFQEC